MPPLKLLQGIQVLGAHKQGLLPMSVRGLHGKAEPVRRLLGLNVGKVDVAVSSLVLGVTEVTEVVGHLVHLTR